MDVFAEDHLNTIIQELEMLNKLKALAPQLKTKVSEKVFYGISATFSHQCNSGNHNELTILSKQ